MLKQFTKLFTLSAFVAIISSISLLPANAVSLNLGGFEGNGTAIVTHGFSVRTEDNNCLLVSGDATGASAAQQALIGGSPYNGNGGCNVKITDPYGNLSSKKINIGSFKKEVIPTEGILALYLGIILPQDIIYQIIIIS